jgi:hypothetical protein
MMEQPDLSDGLCRHDLRLHSVQPLLDVDPDDPLAGNTDPWIILECRICRERELRPYHPFHIFQYYVAPYLVGDAATYTARDHQRIHQFLQEYADMVPNMIRLTIDRALADHETYRQLADCALDQAQRLQTYLTALNHSLRRPTS